MSKGMSQEVEFGGRKEDGESPGLEASTEESIKKKGCRRCGKTGLSGVLACLGKKPARNVVHAAAM